MGCEEDVAKIGKKLENMVANGTTVSLLHKITNKQNKNGSTVRGACRPVSVSAAWARALGQWTWPRLVAVHWHWGWRTVGIGRCRPR